MRTLKPGHLEEDCPITTFSEKKDSQLSFFFFFAYGPCNNIHQFEGCFLRGQVSPNGFKAFKGCIVEYLSFIGLSAKKKKEKKLRIFYFGAEQRLWLDNPLPIVPVWVSALQCTGLDLMVFLPTVILVKGLSVYRLLVAATQINANNQEHNLRKITIKSMWF